MDIQPGREYPSDERNKLFSCYYYKMILGTKCFVTVRFDIRDFLNRESEFFDYVSSNRLE